MQHRTSVNTAYSKKSIKIPILLCPFCTNNIPMIQLKPSIGQMNILISCSCMTKGRIINIHQFIKRLKEKQEIEVHYCIKHTNLRAYKYCSTCSIWLCQKYCDLHQEHNVIDYECNIKCQRHNKQCTQFCKQCDRIICQDCYQIHKEPHLRDDQQMYDFTHIMTHIDQIVFKLKKRIDHIDVWKEVSKSIQSIYKINKKINKDLIVLYLCICKTTSNYKTNPSLLKSLRINTLKYNQKELTIEEEYNKLKEFLQRHYILKQVENKWISKIIERKVTFTCLVVLNDGRLASNCGSLIKIWNTSTNECTATIVATSYHILCLIVLNDGRLASGDYFGTIKLWNTSTLECTKELIAHKNGRIICLEVLHDGRLASGSCDKTIKLWNISTNQCITVLIGNSYYFNCLTKLNDGRLASGSERNITLWKISSNLIISTLSGHNGIVISLVVLKDGKLASGALDQTIKLWNIITNQCTTTLTLSINNYISLCVLNDGRLASGLYNKIILWNTSTFVSTVLLTKYQANINTFAELNDGRLVSGSYETIYLWDV